LDRRRRTPRRHRTRPPRVPAGLHLAFWLNNGSDFVHDASTQNPCLKLRIIHHHAGAGLESRFDLLQVIPVEPVFGGDLMDPEKALEIADLNADDIIDLTDLDGSPVLKVGPGPGSVRHVVLDITSDV